MASIRPTCSTAHGRHAIQPARPPRAVHDLTAECLAHDLAATDARLIEALRDAENYRALALAALAKVSHLSAALRRRDETITALRDELRRYTRSQIHTQVAA